MSESPISLNALKIAPGAGGFFFVSGSPASLNAPEIALSVDGAFFARPLNFSPTDDAAQSQYVPTAVWYLL
jgi:hypothetical protein